MHSRTLIRQNILTLFKAEMPNVKIQDSRRHKNSDYPFINIMSGPEDADFESYADNRTIRSYAVDIDIIVAADNADTETDNFIEIIESVISSNRKNENWDFCNILAVNEPTAEGGETSYLITTVTVVFSYEGGA